jgi:hypothetical protein
VPSFYEVVTAAIKDMTENGFDSAARVERWAAEIRRAALSQMATPRQLEGQLTDSLRAVYKRLVDGGEIYRLNPGASKFTIDRLRPQMRSDLDRRIMASAGLIKLNREQAVEQTNRRFIGWATSIPKGGSKNVDRRTENVEVRKALRSLPYEERRVIVDQGHKLFASINNVVAVGSGAIAGVWHSHFRQAGYTNFRKDHAARDGKVYLLRESWAKEKGFVKVGPAGYYDDVTAVGEEVFCRCWIEWLYTLSQLPKDMVTQKGVEALLALRKAA